MKDNCGTVSEKNTMYFHPDHLGSSSYVTDKKGNFFEMIEYLPYGETLYDEAATVDKTEFRFTSKEMDAETGLYYYGARYYDAKLCKWISTDPVMNYNNSEDLNLYSYCHNKPIVVIDPDGREERPGYWSGNNTVTYLGQFNAFGSDSYNVDYDKSPVSSFAKDAGFFVLGGFKGIANLTTNLFYTPPAVLNELTNMGCDAAGVNRDALVPMTASTPIPFDDMAAYSLAGLKIMMNVVKTETRVTNAIKPIKAIHGNSKVSPKPTTLYELYQNDGNYLKTGITSMVKPEKRYTNKFMADKKMVARDKGSRAEMLAKERAIVEKKPGPLNNEPWARKRK